MAPFGLLTKEERKEVLEIRNAAILQQLLVQSVYEVAE